MGTKLTMARHGMEGQRCPGLHEEEGCQQIKGGDPSPLLCPGKTQLECRARLFSVVSGDSSRGNGLLLKYSKFSLNTGKNCFCFTTKVVSHGDRLPGDVVESPSLERFKMQLDAALGNPLF